MALAPSYLFVLAALYSLSLFIFDYLTSCFELNFFPMTSASKYVNLGVHPKQCITSPHTRVQALK